MFIQPPNPKGIKGNKKPDISKKPLDLNPNLRSFEPVKGKGKPKTFSNPDSGSRGKPPTTVGLKQTDSDSDSDSSSESSLFSSSDSESKPKTKPGGNKMKSKGKRFSGKGDKDAPYWSVPSAKYAKDDRYSSPKNNNQDSELSKRVDPVPSILNKGTTTPVKFSTPIKSTVFTNEFLPSTFTGPEYINKLDLNVASLANGFANSAQALTYLNEIYYQLSTDVIGKGRSSLVTSSWTQAKFRSYIFNVTVALEHYFALDSILVYDSRLSSDRSKNMSYINYQNNFEDYTNILSKKDLLAKYLRDMWCPPRLFALIKWLFQSYKLYDTEQSTIGRYVPTADYVFDTVKPFSAVTLGNTLQAAINNIASTDSSNNAALLTSTFPGGRMLNLGYSNAVPSYDPSWIETWANMSIYYVDELNTGKTSVYPVTLVNTTSDIPYYTPITPEKVDGAMFAITGVATATTITNNIGNAGIVWQNGLLLPQPISTLGVGNNGNKYTYDDTTSVCTRRTSYRNVMNSNDCVNVMQGVSSYFAVATPQTGWTRAYFDNVNAQTINLGYLFDWMFGLVATTS